MGNEIVDQRCTSYRKVLMEDKWLCAEYEDVGAPPMVDMLVAEYRRYILKEIRKRRQTAEKHTATIDMFD